MQLRELARSSPTLLLKALDNPNWVSFEGGVELDRRSAGSLAEGWPYHLHYHVRPRNPFARDHPHLR